MYDFRRNEIRYAFRASELAKNGAKCPNFLWLADSDLSNNSRKVILYDVKHSYDISYIGDVKNAINQRQFTKESPIIHSNTCRILVGICTMASNVWVVVVWGVPVFYLLSKATIPSLWARSPFSHTGRFVCNTGVIRVLNIERYTLANTLQCAGIISVQWILTGKLYFFKTPLELRIPRPMLSQRNGVNIVLPPTKRRFSNLPLSTDDDLKEPD